MHWPFIEINKYYPKNFNMLLLIPLIIETDISLSFIFSLVSAFATIAGAYALIRYQIKGLIRKSAKHSERIKAIEDSIVKDREIMTEKIHSLDKNIIKILTILEENNR